MSSCSWTVGPGSCSSPPAWYCAKRQNHTGVSNGMPSRWQNMLRASSHSSMSSAHECEIISCARSGLIGFMRSATLAPVSRVQGFTKLLLRSKRFT